MTALALVGLCVVALAAADMAGRGVAAAVERAFAPPATTLRVDDHARAALPAYDGVGYDALRVLNEARASDRAVYEPYTMWRRRAYRGEYTNVDISGERRTVGNAQSDDALRVWTLGGSAVWGVGVPDDETIPSRLAAILNGERAVPAVVRNLGERGYVSTQEVIRLMRELQRGARPDVVILYSGVNDAAAVSLWPERPGAHLSLDALRARFEGVPQGGSARWLARSTGLFRAWRSVADRLGPPPFERDGIIVYASDDAYARPNYRYLANRALDVWLFNARVVEALSKEYGFGALMIFQPALWSSGKPLHASEAALLVSEMEYAALGTLMAVRAEMSASLDERASAGDAYEWVINADDLFAQTPEPVYIDYVHVTGRGNDIAARRIASEVVSRYVAARE